MKWSEERGGWEGGGEDGGGESEERMEECERLQAGERGDGAFTFRAVREGDARHSVEEPGIVCSEEVK